MNIFYKLSIIISIAASVYTIGFITGIGWGEQHAFDAVKHLVCPRKPPGTSLEVYKSKPIKKQPETTTPGSPEIPDEEQKMLPPLTLEDLYRYRSPNKQGLIPTGNEIIGI